MRERLFRILIITALAPLALGGAYSHVDGFEVLSKGTFFFPPDHPAHAPFVPEKEHPCAACAVAHVLSPDAEPLYLGPPECRLAPVIDADCAAHFRTSSEVPARAPPVPSTV
jgi:hypothetical protein